ncbi:phospholipase A2 inhibitor and Ly6/PLAUR domain-containing protein-like [Crotalus tigris]|uniref:phospholipase A2 inhibitor and Ly6/PLAUR domain-containing protein-like n=1 Tax=Crotalus tigris TaxID=88082 RepID=UPI00192FB607|nr:phospholipase A2 inhibitor and Ly6/PLAUR domain-containing protein-like [Crotalus tigris]
MRAAGILVFCLFSSILSTVTSLRCQTCVAPINECEGEDVKVEECKEDEEFCSTVVFNSTITKHPMNFVIKECRKREQCLSGSFSTTVIDGRFEVSKTNCCQTDVCNAEPLLLEKYEEFQPNLLRCPSCYAQDVDSCEADRKVRCVGKQDECITLTGTISYGNFTEKQTFQGCTTNNICSYPLGESQMGNGLFQVNVTTLKCRNAHLPDPDYMW